jgi:LPXTG-site transpeptidase (sortase) family protein
VENTEEIAKEQSRENRVRRMKYVISALFAFSGIAILGTQLLPLARSYITGKIMESQVESIKNPTPLQDLDPQDADLPYYDPGLSYFQNLIMHISPDYVAGTSTGPDGTGTTATAKIDKTYKTDMILSIPQIDINNIIITSNVDSFDEKVYNAALKRGLAHFLGTSVPGDGGNSFIYGHSTVDSFFSNHQNLPETIFTKLENAEIADTVTIVRDGKTLEYSVQKKKIVDPNDFKVLTGEHGKETITLMTCWPLGVGSQRLIVIAERTND